MIKDERKITRKAISYEKCDKCTKGIYSDDAGGGAVVGIVCPYCKGSGRRAIGIET